LIKINSLPNHDASVFTPARSDACSYLARPRHEITERKTCSKPRGTRPANFDISDRLTKFSYLYFFKSWKPMCQTEWLRMWRLT